MIEDAVRAGISKLISEYETAKQFGKLSKPGQLFAQFADKKIIVKHSRLIVAMHEAKNPRKLIMRANRVLQNESKSSRLIPALSVDEKEGLVLIVVLPL